MQLDFGNMAASLGTTLILSSADGPSLAAMACASVGLAHTILVFRRMQQGGCDGPIPSSLPSLVSSSGSEENLQEYLTYVSEEYFTDGSENGWWA